MVSNSNSALPFLPPALSCPVLSCPILSCPPRPGLPCLACPLPCKCNHVHPIPWFEVVSFLLFSSSNTPSSPFLERISWVWDVIRSGFPLVAGPCTSLDFRSWDFRHYEWSKLLLPCPPALASVPPPWHGLRVSKGKVRGGCCLSEARPQRCQSIIPVIISSRPNQ